MSGFSDSVNTVNSLIRTLLALTVVVAFGAAGYFGYVVIFGDDLAAQRAEEEFKSRLAEKDQALTDTQRELQSATEQLTDAQTTLQSQAQQLAENEAELLLRQKTIDQQREDIGLLEAQNEQLATSVRLLKFDHRLAQITVRSVTMDPSLNKPVSEIEFVEINDNYESVEKPRVFRIVGDLVYIDNWIVKFKDNYIEQAKDLDRATSLCLFRRIYGEFQEPNDGFQLDEFNSHPNSYARGGRISDFERKIWSDFWSIANNPTKADELGIRAAHGQAVFFKAIAGKKYTLQLRASDGLTWLPPEDAHHPSDKPTT